MKKHTISHMFHHDSRDFSDKKNQWGYKNHSIDVSNFVKDLRKLMGSTIDEFIYDMGWTNDKYYSKIVNGFFDKDKNRKYSNPTVDYIFGALNHAIKNNEKYYWKKDEILKLINRYFLREFS